MFAKTSNEQCAERLSVGSYGAYDSFLDYSYTSYEAFFNRDYRLTLHSHWEQILVLSHGGLTPHIIWQFTNVKSLQDRFQTAVTTGEPVTWTIYYGASEITKTGIWRFSSAAGDMLKKFTDPSSSMISDDDGLWGAASGTVDGNSNSFPSDFWGVGNFHNLDASCGDVHLGSSEPSGYALLHNMMFLSAGGSRDTCPLCYTNAKVALR